MHSAATRNITVCLSLVLALGVFSAPFASAQTASTKSNQSATKKKKAIEKPQNQKSQVLEMKPEAEAKAAVNEQPYIIYLRNLVDGFCTFDGRLRPTGGSWGPRFPIPSVCRNCPTNCAECFQKHQYAPILRVANCTEPAFDFEVRLRNGSGQIGGVIFSITPSCSYPGEVECLEPGAAEKKSGSARVACKQVQSVKLEDLPVVDNKPASQEPVDRR